MALVPRDSAVVLLLGLRCGGCDGLGLCMLAVAQALVLTCLTVVGPVRRLVSLLQVLVVVGEYVGIVEHSFRSASRKQGEIWGGRGWRLLTKH